MIFQSFTNLIAFSPKNLTDYLYGKVLFLCYDLEKETEIKDVCIC